MEKSTVVTFGVALNLIVLIGIVYVHYLSPRRSGTVISKQQRDEQHSGQETAPTYRIAIVTSKHDSNVQNLIEGFMDTIKANAKFIPEYKLFNANGSRSLMRSQIDQVIDGDYDLIYAIGSKPAQMCKEITKKRERMMPIVFGGTGDPIKLGLMETPEHSGNNLTGASILGTGWIDKMVDLLPIMLPKVKRVLIPYDPTGLGGALESYKQQFDRAFARNNIEVTSIKVFETNEITQKVSPFVSKVDMIVVLPDAVVLAATQAIVRMAEKERIPTYVAMNVESVRGEGMAVAFGYSTRDVGAASAGQAIRILDLKQEPGQIPLDPLDTRQSIVINKENAQRQGFFDRADTDVLFLMENAQVYDDERRVI